jgi:uncharacterized protein YifN (PemK superfamily)
MPITFAPDPGQILMCDFTRGFMRPEMQKIRHCVVVSPKKHSGTCLIVPLSLDPPHVVELWHFLFPRNAYPCMAQNADIWAKADMLTHAAFDRLDRPLEHHVRVRRLLQPTHLKNVLVAVLHAVNCGHAAGYI